MALGLSEDRKGIEPLIETNPARVLCFYVTVTYPYFLTLRLRVSRFPGFLFVTLRILLLENFNLLYVGGAGLLPFCPNRISRRWELFNPYPLLNESWIKDC